MFTTKHDQAKTNTRDSNFLAYDKTLDAFKTAIMSPSGTNAIPVYLDSPIPVGVEVDITTDSIKVFSASGNPELPVYTTSPVESQTIDPIDRNLIKKRVFYNAAGDITSLREAVIATPSGSQCVVKTFVYDNDSNISYTIENLGSW